MSDPKPDLAAPDTLLGGLQRGRGDAVRALLDRPKDPEAHAIVIECLCTRYLGVHMLVEGMVELLIRLRPQLDPWLEHVASLRATSDDDGEVYFHFTLLGRMVAAGSIPCRRALERELGRDENRMTAVWQAGEYMDLDLWRIAVNRMSADEIEEHAHTNWKNEHWARLEEEDQRFRGVLQALRARHRENYAPEKYDSAERSSSRWQIVKECIKQSRPEASMHLVDGLWDMSERVRRECVELVDTSLPGVTERLLELSDADDEPLAKSARKRLAEIEGD